MEKPRVPAEIRALVGQDSLVQKIEKVNTFDHTCQGEERVACTAVVIIYDPEKVEPDHEFPMTAVVVDDSVLGRGAHVADNAPDKKVADELIDGLCVKAGCANGAKCAKKRKKTE